jgi:hypothetical protein
MTILANFASGLPRRWPPPKYAQPHRYLLSQSCFSYRPRPRSTLSARFIRFAPFTLREQLLVHPDANHRLSLLKSSRDLHHFRRAIQCSVTLVPRRIPGLHRLDKCSCSDSTCALHRHPSNPYANLVPRACGVPRRRCANVCIGLDRGHLLQRTTAHATICRVAAAGIEISFHEVHGAETDGAFIF